MPREYGDIKYYYEIHCRRQESQGRTPVSYNRFTRRLRTMNLHDAIYSPRVEYQVKSSKKLPPTVQDYERRLKELNEENVMILDLDKLVELETEAPVVYPRETNKIQIPKPKQTLRHRFISLFKKNVL